MPCTPPVRAPVGVVLTVSRSSEELEELSALICDGLQGLSSKDPVYQTDPDCAPLTRHSAGHQGDHNIAILLRTWEEYGKHWIRQNALMEKGVTAKWTGSGSGTRLSGVKCCQVLSLSPRPGMYLKYGLTSPSKFRDVPHRCQGWRGLLTRMILCTTDSLVKCFVQMPKTSLNEK